MRLILYYLAIVVLSAAVVCGFLFWLRDAQWAFWIGIGLMFAAFVAIWTDAATFE